ncbi:outer membrane autotransporter protein [Labrenzia sp. MBR-25]
MFFHARLSRLRTALLLSSALVSSAMAGPGDGGRGGFSTSGDQAGTASLTGAGGDASTPGTKLAGGAGGGAGVTGGAGGVSFYGDRDGGAGGAHGYSGDGVALESGPLSIQGTNGDDGTDTNSNYGAGGGGGGGFGAVATGSSSLNVTSGSIAGGTGGAGGDNFSKYAGGGGSGGYGLVLNNTNGTHMIGATVTGGDGGKGGGSNYGNYNDGGDGGDGILVTGHSSPVTVVIQGNVSGGAGGDGGDISESYDSDGGNAGNGVKGGNINVVLTGDASLAGGMGGARGNTADVPNKGSAGSNGRAIRFTGGTNSLELQATAGGSVATLTGGIAHHGSTDVLKLGGDNDADFDLSGLGGTFSGFGSYEKTGTATWTLTGNTASTKGWTVSSGVLKLEGGSIAGMTTISSGATLQFDQTADTTHAASIGGAGSLKKTGSGTLTLTGANTYSGGTAIEGGTLSGSSFAIRGNVAVSSGAVVDFNEATDVTNANVISGAGKLQKSGSGTLTLTGANTYSGGTAVKAGTLSGSSSAIRGNVAVSSGAVVDFIEATDVTNANVISGAGMMQKSGSGTLTLTGANTYSGGTMIKAGTLIADTTSISGDIYVGSGATMRFNQDVNTGYSGGISGSGTLHKFGTGSLSLTGAYSLTGETKVWGGELLIGGAYLNASSSFDLTGGSLTISGAGARTIRELKLGTSASLNLDGGSLTVSQAVSSTQHLSLIGTGTLNLDQAGNSFGGGVTLRHGSLVVGTASTRKTASLAADVEVLKDAILGGHGSITGAVTNNGRIAPGNSIGTLTINGDLSGSGVLDVEVDGNRSGTLGADKLIVNGAVDVSAMTLNLVLSPTDAAHWSYGPTGPFTIIENDGNDAVVGPFADVNDNLLFLDASLDYTAGTGNDVQLTLFRNEIDMVAPAQTVNQTATAAAIEALGNTNPVYLSVVTTVGDANAARAAFDSLSGEINGTFRSVLVSDSDLTRDRLLTRLRSSGSSGPGLWGNAIGNWGHYGSNEGTFDADSTTGGFLFGYDHNVSQALTVGVLAGYTRTDVSVDQLNSRAKADSFHLGFYAGGVWNGLTYKGGVATAYNDADVDRDVRATSTLSQSLTSDQQIYSTQVFAETGYEFDLRGVTLEPFAGVARLHLASSGFTEEGGSAALTAAGQGDDTGFVWIGLRTAAAFELFGAAATAKASVAWQHASEENVTFTQAFASGGDRFTVNGAPFSRDTAQVDAGLGVNLGENTNLDFSYSGRLASKTQNHGLNARLSIRF